MLVATTVWHPRNDNAHKYRITSNILQSRIERQSNTFYTFQTQFNIQQNQVVPALNRTNLNNKIYVINYERIVLKS